MDDLPAHATFSHDIDSGQLAALQRGCPTALAETYDRFSRPVYGLALRVLGNPDDAADLVQDVFLKLPRAVRQFRGDAPFGAWLRRMTANATIDRLRERRLFKRNHGPGYCPADGEGHRSRGVYRLRHCPFARR